MPEFTAEEVTLIDDGFNSLLNALDPASLDQMDQGLKDQLISIQQLLESKKGEAQGPQYQNSAGGPGE